MSSKALAIRWRPNSFEKIVGQEHVVKALRNSLEKKRLHHAWLMTGTRGVGKTSLARILAKALNCADGINSHPCNQCDFCKQITLGSSVDVVELDAASHTQVENMRELLEGALYAPSSMRYKVFIIDEVHMLSKSAFNAMLKSLEEPPDHVKFILATTDAQKLPVTVLSRCLRFNLKKIQPRDIIKQVESILDKEQIKYQPEAIKQLALAGDGSMRDCLSLVDQAIALGDDNISAECVRDMLGGIDSEDLISLIEAISSKKSAQIFEATNRIINGGMHLEQALSEFGTMVAQISLIKSYPEAIDEEIPHKSQLYNLSKLFSPEELQLMYQIILQGRRDFEWAPDINSAFSMVIMRIHAFQAVVGSQLNLDRKLDNFSEKKKIEVGDGEEDIKYSFDSIGDWSDVVSKLKLGGMARMLADNCQLTKCDNKVLEFLVPRDKKNLLNKAYIDKLKSSLEYHVGSGISVSFNLGDKVETPLSKRNSNKREILRQATEILLDDKFGGSLVEDFDARIIESSIQLNKE